MVFLPSIEEENKALQIEEVRAVTVGKGPGSICVPVRIVPLLRKAGILINHVLMPSNRAKPTEEQKQAMRERRGGWKGDFFITRELLNPHFNEEKGVTHAKKEAT